MVRTRCLPLIASGLPITALVQFVPLPVLHARPATVDGQQRLFRWNPDQQFPVTSEYLIEGIAEIEDMMRENNSGRLAAAVVVGQVGGRSCWVARFHTIRRSDIHNAGSRHSRRVSSATPFSLGRPSVPIS